VFEILDLFTIHNVLDSSPQKSPSVQDLGFREARKILRPSQSRHCAPVISIGQQIIAFQHRYIIPAFFYDEPVLIL
jgi:hypothetical protein